MVQIRSYFHNNDTVKSPGKDFILELEKQSKS